MSFSSGTLTLAMLTSYTSFSVGSLTTSTSLIYKGNELSITFGYYLPSGQKLAAALLPLLFGTNLRSHHQGASGRV